MISFLPCFNIINAFKAVYLIYVKKIAKRIKLMETNMRRFKEEIVKQNVLSSIDDNLYPL